MATSSKPPPPSPRPAAKKPPPPAPAPTYGPGGKPYKPPKPNTPKQESPLKRLVDFVKGKYTPKGNP